MSNGFRLGHRIWELHRIINIRYKMISDVSEVLAEMENSNKREKGKSEFLRATALPSERISLHSKSHK